MDYYIFFFADDNYSMLLLNVCILSVGRVNELNVLIFFKNVIFKNIINDGTY